MVMPNNEKMMESLAKSAKKNPEQLPTLAQIKEKISQAEAELALSDMAEQAGIMDAALRKITERTRVRRDLLLMLKHVMEKHGIEGEGIDDEES